MRTFSFRTFIQKDGTQYHGFVPALPGCHTFGETIEETKQNLNEAIEGYVVSCIENKDTVPSDEVLEVSPIKRSPKEIREQWDREVAEALASGKYYTSAKEMMDDLLKDEE